MTCEIGARSAADQVSLPIGKSHAVEAEISFDTGRKNNQYMWKVKFAAAFAAGMMSFAVNAQEAPGIANASSMMSASKVTSDEAEKPSEKAASGGWKSTHSGRASMAVPTGAANGKKTIAKDEKGRTKISLEGQGALPGVDPETTESISPGKRPDLVAKARKEEVVTGGRASGSYSEIVARYASAYGVPVSLAHAVIRVESNYRVNARGSAGEVGLMQIKPSTARGLGYSGSLKGLYNPETNIKYGMKYLGMAHKLGGGSTCGTILKYNAGHGARRMNPVSAAYCSKVKRHLAS